MFRDLVRHPGWPVSLLQMLPNVALFAVLLASSAIPAAGQGKPKLRTVTAFVRLDPAQYQQQITEALTMLRNAKARFDLAGYQTESIRIATQPFTEYTTGMSHPDTLAFFQALDAMAKREGFNISIGPAMMADKDDPAQAQLLAEILASTSNTFGSVVVAGSDGVHWQGVRAAASVMKYLEDHGEQGLGNFHFAAIANVAAYTPFFPAAYHQGLGRQFAIALESANVVAGTMAVKRDPDATRQALVADLGVHARAVETVANMIDYETGWSYMGLDLSPAPMKQVSIGSAIANFTGSHFGASGTLTASATITFALGDLAVKKTGFSGLMLPVMEDTRLAQMWSQGTLSLDQLLAYSAVCGTGLDTIPLPGDVTAQQLERIIGDVASLSAKLSKPLSARLMPVRGGKPGDMTTFDDPNIVNTVIQALP